LPGASNAQLVRMQRSAESSIARRIKDVEGMTIAATAGDIGKVVDCFFDDDSWTVRHFVVDTGGWLRGRRVLLFPAAVREIDIEHRRLLTTLSREKVEHSPDVDTDRPVSRQQEIGLHQYYGYPYYWTGPYRWGYTPTPWAAAIAGIPFTPVAPPRERRDDPHLRSARAVTGYGIHATDGDVGHLVDFLMEDEIVDPRRFWPARHVLIAVDWITWVAWGERRVHVNATRDELRHAPPYDPSAVIDRDWERAFFRAHGRPAPPRAASGGPSHIRRGA